MSKSAVSREENEELSKNDAALLNALERDLSSTVRGADNRLFLFIGLALVAALLPNYISMPRLAVDALSVLSFAAVLGGLAFTAWSVIQKKQAIAKKYGLHCSVCGRRPRTSQIVLVAQVAQCSNCRNRLSPRIP